MLDSKLLGKRIQKYRRIKKWSAEKFAEIIDVSVPYIRELERGAKTPSMKMFVKIANELNVTADELFVKMQPVFISKYNWGIERGDNGELSVLDKKYKYDVNLEEDGTFVIWWRMSVAKAFLSTRHYPIYKNAIATMGIIAYEVQQAFSVGMANENR